MWRRMSVQDVIRLSAGRVCRLSYRVILEQGGEVIRVIIHSELPIVSDLGESFNPFRFHCRSFKAPPLRKYTSILYHFERWACFTFYMGHMMGFHPDVTLFVKTWPFFNAPNHIPPPALPCFSLKYVPIRTRQNYISLWFDRRWRHVTNMTTWLIGPVRSTPSQSRLVRPTISLCNHGNVHLKKSSRSSGVMLKGWMHVLK